MMRECTYSTCLVCRNYYLLIRDMEIHMKSRHPGLWATNQTTDLETILRYIEARKLGKSPATDMQKVETLPPADFQFKSSAYWEN